MSENNENIKVFRLHQGIRDEDWFVVDPYDTREIDGIKDPAGASDLLEITSIPSPFARFDLVLSAFRHINELESERIDKGLTTEEETALDGNTIHHKLISEALDIAQILFNYENLNKKIRIISWERKTDLNKIRGIKNEDDIKDPEPVSKAHKLLGDTLELYLNQDKDAYNFEKLDRLFFIEYIDAPIDQRIIGGTSPATLFFSSAGDKSFVDIRFGGHKPFYSPKDSTGFTYPALYKRDVIFQKYLYFLIKNFDTSDTNALRAFQTYLDNNLKIIQAAKDNNKDLEVLYGDLDDMNQKGLEFDLGYEKLEINGGNPVEIFGIELLKRPSDDDQISKTSDFRILSEKYKGLLPLALPHKTYNYKLRYTTGNWKSSTKVETNPKKNYTERILPNVDTKYPWIATSDFLEPYLVSLPYKFNDKDFFDGNLDSDLLQGFLLPIKPLFFDFFDTDYLRGQQNDGNKNIEIIEKQGGSFKVILRIAIQPKGKYITFERTYLSLLDENIITEPNLEKNEGYVLNTLFSVGVFPNIRSENNLLPIHYRISLLSRDLGKQDSSSYKLFFYKRDNSTLNQNIDQKNEEHTEVIEKKRSGKEFGDANNTIYYALNQNFDYIQFSNNDQFGGVLIPNFRKEIRGSKAAKFAIDFGTTFSHIEYRIDDQDPRPFEITKSNYQLSTTDEAYSMKDLAELMNWEYTPKHINNNTLYSFPQRSIIGFHHSLQFGANKKIEVLADISIPFPFELETQPKNISINPKLKWSDYVSNNNGKIKNEESVKAYLEQLIFYIRNQVLIMPDVDPLQTEITWSYPSSMLSNRKSKLEKIWIELLEKYFTSDCKLSSVSESIAPFYYYAAKEQVAYGQKPGLSIDIGGETTDIVIFENINKKPIISSFRYGAKAIYGDGFAGGSNNNGFILKYREIYNVLLGQDKSLSKIADSMKATIDKYSSVDVISFFFSIDKHRMIRNQSSFSFAQKLADDSSLKIVFLFYYASIIFHSVKLMKAKGLKMPESITFSGTASKMLNFIDVSRDYKNLNKLTKEIITNVYEEKVDKLNLYHSKNPKEVTAKGALFAIEEYDAYELNSILLGGKSTELITSQNKKYYDSIFNKEGSLKKELAEEIIEEVNSFIDLFFKLHQKVDYNNYFGIEVSYLDKYQDLLKINLHNHLTVGLDKLLTDVIKNNNSDRSKTPISETLFFYPLIGALNKLAFEITNGLDN